MIVVIDNYDSFTFNLFQYLGQLGCETTVYRNDQIDPEKIDEIDPEAIVISPGPCTPKEAGITIEVIQRYHTKVPILGVCLGHQAIGYAFGAEVTRADRLMHGKTSPIYNDGKTIFQGLPNPLVAGRYHSLVLKRGTLPDCFEVTAETQEGEIMGIRHRNYPLEGVQFHPESILTPKGKRILYNFLEIKKPEGNRRQQ